jgi:hypothetical protein
VLVANPDGNRRNNYAGEPIIVSGLEVYSVLICDGLPAEGETAAKGQPKEGVATNKQYSQTLSLSTLNTITETISGCLFNEKC